MVALHGGGVKPPTYQCTENVNIGDVELPLDPPPPIGELPDLFISAVLTTLREEA